MPLQAGWPCQNVVGEIFFRQVESLFMDPLRKSCRREFFEIHDSVLPERDGSPTTGRTEHIV